MASEQEVSWLNIADEGSGALLNNRVQRQAVMTQWSQAEACSVMEQNFEQWTLPRCIKIDNGLPFVNSKCRDNPTMPILWWVGLGIKVIQNTPRRPQENGIVKNLQGTTHRWVNLGLCHTPEQLQEATLEVARRQREVYRIRRKKRQNSIGIAPQPWRTILVPIGARISAFSACIGI